MLGIAILFKQLEALGDQLLRDETSLIGNTVIKLGVNLDQKFN